MYRERDVHMCVYVYIYIYIYSYISHQAFFRKPFPCNPLHSAKGGAVETGCSELYDVMHYFTI